MNLPAKLPSVPKAKLPEVYQQARGALEKCTRIDECKDWADKAEALASYAKQANDDALRKMADRIQARAIRRCGQLLEEIEKGKNRHDSRRSPAGPPNRRAAARDAGMSPRQQRTALRVARVPSDQFDESVDSDDPPTVTALADRGKLPAPSFNLHGRDPEDFKRATATLSWIRSVSEFCEANDPGSAVDGLLPKELRRKKSIAKQAAAIRQWLGKFERKLK